ncbi:MAG: TolC family protein [Bdellovibrionales bacterium]|nr:TolC family protein [Bdellovibrionales bacterium]
MYRAISLIFLISVSINHSEASFSNLMKDFLINNQTIKENSLSVNLKKLDQDGVINKFDWYTNISAYNNNNELGSSSSFNFAAGQHSNVSLSISRETSWGGAFSISNSFTRNSRDPEDAAIFGSNELDYEFEQGISYSQDLGINLFGRSHQIDVDVVNTEVELKKIINDNSKNYALIDLYSKYLTASLKKSFIVLQEKAYARAQKRKLLIKQRYNDGISLKVDLLQAKSAEVLQKEQLHGSSIELENSLKELSLLLHREVSLVEISELDSNLVKFTAPNQFDWNVQHNIKLVDQQKSLLELSHKKITRSMKPDLKLTLDYKTNNYDTEGSDVLTNGNIISSNENEITVGLSLLWPWGKTAQKVALEKVKQNKILTEYKKTSTMKNLKNSWFTLQKNITQLENKIESARRRLSFSEQVLNEYNKLFRLGKVPLDQVIRAEEGLIITEKQLLSYLLVKQVSEANAANLFDNLNNFLREHP